MSDGTDANIAGTSLAPVKAWAASVERTENARAAGPCPDLQASDFADRGGCPLCGSTQHVLHLDFEDLPVVRCTQCQFIYSKAVLSDEALGRYYAMGFGGLRQRQGQLVNARVNTHMLARLVRPQPGMTMLDVGAGYGYLLRQMQNRFGVVGVGVEPSLQEAEFARNELGVNVMAHMLNSAGLPKAAFDVVVSFEVIEHVPHPLLFLQELLTYVKPGGLLVVMTDNFGSAAVKSLGKGFPKWIPHTHISHFAADTMATSMRNLGGVQIERVLSFTPWEFQARRLANWVGQGGRGPAYSLRQALVSERGGQYRFYRLRRWLNVAWARLSAQPNLDGAAMYVACRKARL